jgi:hypothetical protein
VKLHAYSIEQLAIQISGDIAINHYRVKMGWAGPGPAESKMENLRITPTWMRTANAWQIIGGTSARVNSEDK